MRYFSEEFSKPPSSRMQKLARKRRRRKTILLSLLILLLLGMLGAYLWLRGLESKMTLKPREAAKIARVVTKPKVDEAVNILLVGTDSRVANGPSRADSIMILRVDKERGVSYLVSIPRDSRVEIAGHGMDKINHSWAFGGAPLLIQTVSKFTDIDTHYFLQVDFVSFAKIVDAMGGVRFATDKEWYDGELGVEVRAGDQLRAGKEALALVRNRHDFAAGDFARMQNQQAFLMAISQQAAASYTSWPGIASTMATYSKTNMDTTTMLKLAGLMRDTQGNMQRGRIPTRGTSIGGTYYGIPDNDSKEEIVAAMKQGAPLPPSAIP